MSKRDKIAKIKEYIKNLVVQELNKEEELEEVSTTATAGIDGTGTGHYDTPMAFSGKSKKSKKKKKKISHASGMKPVNESQPFADFTQFPKLSRDQQESLDELFGFAESYQIYNAFENNPKKFIQTLNDMAKIRKASNKKPKGVNFNKGKKQFVKEVTNEEISALQNVEKGLKKLQQDYIKITKIGDKTLRNRQYNDYYEYIIGAKEGIGKLIQTLKRKQMLGEGSMDWEKDFKWANEKELKVIAKLVHMNNGIAPVIKMSKKPDFKSFIKRAAKKGLGESIDEAMNPSAIKKMRDEFEKTGDLPPHLKKFALDLKILKKKHKVKNIVVPGLEWMSDMKEQSVNEAKMSKSQAKELLQQLGGNKFIAMTGAKNFGTDGKSLTFKIGRNSKGVNFVRIKLTSMDLYDIEFLQVRAGKIKIKSKAKRVYADQLGKMFKKNTGMNVRL